MSNQIANIMKKLTYLFGLGILAASLFISCSPDEDALPPSLNITSDNPVVAVPNSVITIAWRADAGDAKLATFTIKEGNVAILDEDNIDWNNFEIASADNESYVGSANVRVGTAATEFSLIVTDKDGKEASATVTVTIDNTAGDPIYTYSARLMGAQSNLTLGSYLNANSGEVLKQAAAEASSASIDVVYYYGSANLATLTAPDDVTVNGGAENLSLCSGFSVKNATRFATTSLTPSDFDAVEDDAAFTETVSSSKLTQLAVSDVIAFETAAGKKGLIRVSALTAGNTESITIDVKIQQ
jgi:hypothetical protein